MLVAIDACHPLYASRHPFPFGRYFKLVPAEQSADRERGQRRRRRAGAREPNHNSPLRGRMTKVI